MQQYTSLLEIESEALGVCGKVVSEGPERRREGPGLGEVEPLYRDGGKASRGIRIHFLLEALNQFGLTPIPGPPCPPL